MLTCRLRICTRGRTIVLLRSSQKQPFLAARPQTRAHHGARPFQRSHSLDFVNSIQQIPVSLLPLLHSTPSSASQHRQARLRGLSDLPPSSQHQLLFSHHQPVSLVRLRCAIPLPFDRYSDLSRRSPHVLLVSFSLPSHRGCLGSPSLARTLAHATVSKREQQIATASVSIACPRASWPSNGVSTAMASSLISR